MLCMCDMVWHKRVNQGGREEMEGGKRHDAVLC